MCLRGIAALRHRGIVALRDCVFALSCLCGIVALRDCVFALSCLRGSAASWHCGIAGLVLRNMLIIRVITGGLCSVRGSPDNVRGKEAFYKCLIPCKVRVKL